MHEITGTFCLIMWENLIGTITIVHTSERESDLAQPTNHRFQANGTKWLDVASDNIRFITPDTDRILDEFIHWFICISILLQSLL